MKNKISLVLVLCLILVFSLVSCTFNEDVPDNSNTGKKNPIGTGTTPGGTGTGSGAGTGGGSNPVVKANKITITGPSLIFNSKTETYTATVEPAGVKSKVK